MAIDVCHLRQELNTEIKLLKERDKEVIGILGEISMLKNEIEDLSRIHYDISGGI